MAQTAHDQTARVPRTGLCLAPGRPAGGDRLPTRQAAGRAVRLASPSQPQHRPGYARVSPAAGTSGHASGQLTQRTHLCRKWYKTVQCPHGGPGTPVGEFCCAAASPRSGKLFVATATRSLRTDRRFRDHGSSWRRVPPCSGVQSWKFPYFMLLIPWWAAVSRTALTSAAVKASHATQRRGPHSAARG